MEGYTIRKTAKVNGIAIGVYFKDNESPPLFILSDISRLISSDCCVATKLLIDVAEDQHCTKIQTNISYTVWACDFEGFCNIIHKFMEENANDIINTVNNFVTEQYRIMPGPLTVKQGIRTATADYFDSIVKVADGCNIRYVVIENTVWFAAQDIRRCFNKNATFVEEKFEAINNEDKLLVTFNGGEQRLCINDNAVSCVADQIMSKDVATKFVFELISKSKPVVRSKNTHTVVAPKATTFHKDVIIDGRATDKSRYMVSEIADGNKIVLLRYDHNTILNFFSVGATANILDVDVNTVNLRAKRKRPLFIYDDGIYVDIDSLRYIFRQADPSLRYCKVLSDRAALQKEIALANTNVNYDIVYITKEQLEKTREGFNMREKFFKPLSTTGKWSVIAYDNIEVNDKTILVCLGKENWKDPNEEITPLFWATSIGFFTNYGNIGKTINNVCSKDDYCKISIPELKKFNIKIITLNGLKKAFEDITTTEESDKWISALQSAVENFIEQQQKDLKFRLEKYSIQEKAKAKVQEVEVVMEEEQKETPTDETADKTETPNTLTETTITFRDQQLRIAVSINKDKGAIIYYDIKQLCDILQVNPSKLGSYTPYKDNDGNETLISIYDLSDALGTVTANSADITQTLFEVSKPTVVAIADSMGFKVKDSTQKQEDLMVKLLGSEDSRNYTLGAIILAERFRETITRLRKQQKSIGGIPGPSNYKLLEDLWKYIDCQESDRDIPFNFKKQVVAVNERYHRLKED